MTTWYGCDVLWKQIGPAYGFLDHLQHTNQCSMGLVQTLCIPGRRQVLQWVSIFLDGVLPLAEPIPA